MPSITHRQRQFENAQASGRVDQRREIWNAKNLTGAEAELKSLVEAYRNKAPELAAWLEVAIPEGLAVFTPQSITANACGPPTRSNAPSSRS